MKKTSNVEPKRHALPFIFALVLVLVWGSTAHSTPSPDLDRAARPLLEGVPSVAIVRLRELLTQELSEEERRIATVQLAETLVAAGEPEAALQLLEQPEMRDLPGVQFTHAQALAALGRWVEALPLYERTAADATSPLRSDAAFGRAESLRALGRTDAALQALKALRSDPRWAVRARLRSVPLLLEKGNIPAAGRMLDSVQPNTLPERKERRFLHGRIEWKRNNLAHAAELFGSILKAPEGASHSLIVATLFAIADVHLQAHTPDTGDDPIEDFIEHHPSDPDLAEIFAKLDQLYAAERMQGRHELGRWSNEAAQPRRAFAQWYLARAELRQNHREAAAAALDRLRADHPMLPVLAEALLEQAELERQDGHDTAAIAALDSGRALHPPQPTLDRINFLAGEMHYATRQFDVAAQQFQEIAKARSGSGGDALYNASLAWLEAGAEERFAAAAQSLTATAEAQPQRGGDLLLEQGLVQAGKGDPAAAESLAKFLREFPQHERAAEAWVALAELAFHAAPPRIAEARANLAHVGSSPLSDGAAERADYLAIWLEDAAPTADEAKVIGLAGAFLQKYVSSPLASEVRMKLAEAYFHRQDFAGAQTQFELLVQQNPASPEAEKAQFFAAQSAMQSMGRKSLDRALLLFDDVVKRNGELKWPARNEQAVIERKLGQPQDAITLYDEVMRADSKPDDKREAVCGKADILYEMGSADTENYRRAIALYDQLAAEKGVSAHWRNQALFKKGMCLEKLEAPEEALAAFYKIVEDENRPDRPREYFWFYKAGFNAARLLEKDSKWRPAAAVYEKLAFAGGARSEEAKSRLNRLRLEHFLWD